MLKYYIKLLLALILSTTTIISKAQEKKTFQGQVIDLENDSPLLGVSITVKENSQLGGTTTDNRGNFVISIQDGQSLEISYLGYIPQQIKVQSNQNNLVIRLEKEVKTLAEVVVTGALGFKRSSRELGTS